MFKLWSEINSKAKETLRPDLGIRPWGQLTDQDKEVIWQHFINKKWFRSEERTHGAVYSLDERNKARAFCNHILSHGGPHYYDPVHSLQDCCGKAAQMDFHHIFHQEHEDVIFELFSYYAVELQNDSLRDESLTYFRNCFNDISDQFSLSVIMVEDSFVPRQDEKIIKETYEPVLNFLSDSKWKEVNNLLSDAFGDYRKNSPQGYSNCVTNIVSAIQAFLQIVVYEETGKGDISKLILEAQTKKLIPDNFFTKRIFKNLDSIIACERQKTSISHPKKQYANEKDARLMMNLAMVFIQHCIQK